MTMAARAIAGMVEAGVGMMLACPSRVDDLSTEEALRRRMPTSRILSGSASAILGTDPWATLTEQSNHEQSNHEEGESHALPQAG
jgi:hypothetical protein